MRIFVAYPFTSKLGRNCLLPREYIEELMLIKSTLEYMGHSVMLAHEREEWGKSIFPPKLCTEMDFKGILQADAIIAYPGNPPSGGVHIELGWASALGKRIFIIQKSDENYSPLVEGLSSIAEISLIKLEPKASVDRLITLLKELIPLTNQNPRGKKYHFTGDSHE